MEADRLRKALSLLGILPLGAYLALHLWETSAAVSGRHAFVARVSGLGGGTLAVLLETALVVVPLGLHATLGVLLAARQRPAAAGGYATPGARWLARITGIGLLLFLVLHLAHTWAMKLSGTSAEGVYETLRAEAGEPLYVLVYLIGITCAAFHVGLAVGALPETWGFARTDAGRRALRGLGAVLGVVVWLVCINTLSHFVVGRAFLGAPAAQEAAP